MRIWLGEHDVWSGQFALLMFGYDPGDFGSPAQARKLLAAALEPHLPRLELELERRGPYLAASARSPGGDVHVRAHVRDARLLVTCHAFDAEPHGLIQALELLAVLLDPREVELVGFPDDGRSGRQPYDTDGLVFSRITHKQASRFQLIEVGEHPVFGRVLFLNGEAQIASSDEDHYSSQLIKGAVRKGTRRVLIMGGGDCGVLRQVLTHEQVEHVVMAEIDEAVITTCQEYFPQVVGGSPGHPRAEIVIGDAFAYVRAHPGEFDLIVYDLSDTPLNLEGYGEVFPLINTALAKGGRVAVQCGSGMPQDHVRLREILASMRKAFSEVKTREVVVPSFVHRPWVFGYAGRKG